MLLGVLAHVECDQCIFVAEQELREGLAQLRLPHTGRTGEDERTAGSLGVLQPCPGAPNGLGQGVNRLLLTDHPLVQFGLHPQQALGFFFGELEHRDAGGGGEHFGDDLLVHLGDDVEIAGFPFLLALRFGCDEFLLFVAQASGLLEVLGVDGGLFIAAHIGDPVVELPQVRRGGHPADAQAGAGLVDEVDGLVRQVPVVDVAVSHGGRCHQCAIGDGDLVVGLVAIPQALENLDGLRERRLVDLDRLETALECSVLLDVLAVFVQRGGTDGLQLPAGQHRLEDAGGVDGSFGRTRTHQRVHLVDEQDDVAAGADLLEHLLQPLFEIAAVARTGHQRTEIQGVELLVFERLGHLVAHDHLRQALHHGCFTHAGLADQHRVVLGAPGQHLHDALNFHFSADHRVEFAFPGRLREVAAELVEHERRGGCALGRTGAGSRFFALVPGQQLDDLLAHPVEVRAELDQHLCRHTFPFPDQAEQNVFSADVVVPELQSLPQRQLENLFGPGGKWDVTAGGLLALADDLFHLGAHGFQGDAHRLQGLRRHAFTFVNQPEQDVLGADVVVVEHARFFLGQHDDPAGTVGKPFKHWALLSIRGFRADPAVM